MDNSWIKIHRQIESWDWYQDSNTKALFLHLLIRASFKERSWRGITVNRGQLITGRKKLAVQLGLSEQNIRTSMDKLKLTNEVTIHTTNEYSLITVNNYEEYQGGNQQTNQGLTKVQPTSNQGLTTIEERKNVKKDKKDIYGEFVLLDANEKSKLEDKFGPEFESMIERLDLYIGSSGKKYKSHYHTLLAWWRREHKAEKDKTMADYAKEWRELGSGEFRKKYRELYKEPEGGDIRARKLMFEVEDYINTND